MNTKQINLLLSLNKTSLLTIEQALLEAVLLLKDSESARLDAAVLLCHVLNKPSSFLYTWPEKKLTASEYRTFQSLIARREKGEPIAYIVGYRDFWSLRLKVSNVTLIPRPDTELLVELALERLPDQGGQILDLGTGTGAIALSLAFERENIFVIGVDVRDEAISLARENQAQLAIKNADFMQSNWFEALKERKFSMIVSNPPYIDKADPHLQQGDVRFEPSSALVSGENGLADIRKICQQSVKYLEISGWLLIEHGCEQGQYVRNIFRAAGFHHIGTKRDYSGLERVTLGRTLAN